MTKKDKAKNAAKVAQGKMKEVAGITMDDKRMENEGKNDQSKAHVKQAAQNLKDAVE
jgi:uncharacterized protein YjbJ (UPF0337 family)